MVAASEAMLACDTPRLEELQAVVAGANRRRIRGPADHVGRYARGGLRVGGLILAAWIARESHRPAIRLAIHEGIAVGAFAAM